MSALFTIEIDNEPYPAPEKTMTANAILSLGGTRSEGELPNPDQAQQQDLLQGQGRSGDRSLRRSEVR